MLQLCNSPPVFPQDQVREIEIVKGFMGDEPDTPGAIVSFHDYHDTYPSAQISACGGYSNVNKLNSCVQVCDSGGNNPMP